MSLADRILDEVDRLGVLLVQDRDLPSVTTLADGGPITGSWWAHPRAHEIFDALNDEGVVTDSPGAARDELTATIHALAASPPARRRLLPW